MRSTTSTIVQQQHVLRTQVARQVLVVQAHAFLVAQFTVLAPLGVQDEAGAVFQLDLAFFEFADADLRTLQVGHDGNFTAALGGGVAHHAGALHVVLRFAVREIQAYYVNAGLEHADQGGDVVRCGADGCHDFGGAAGHCGWGVWHVVSFLLLVSVTAQPLSHYYAGRRQCR
jgi:hypothetical protein